VFVFFLDVGFLCCDLSDSISNCISEVLKLINVIYLEMQDLHELFSIPESGFDVSLTQQQLHEEHDSQHEMYVLFSAFLKFLNLSSV
jgi:hypothetical protein